jgi:valyl-tRNA synthetase
VQVPLTTRVIPVITDDYVDPEFGTGCVKITPAHDFNDYEVGQRHEMEVINLFTPDAVMNENAPAAYQGMDRFVARDKIVLDLDAEGLLVKTEDHVYKRPYGDRSGVVIEPYLTDQWFVRAEPLAKPSIEAVKDGRIRFIPEKRTGARLITTGWKISRTGVFRANSGGAIAYPPGMTITAIFTSRPALKRRIASTDSQRMSS